MTAQLEIAPVHVVGRYALYDQIATGGMATVHIGRLHGAVGFARTVAIKRLYPPYARNAEFVSMFVDEARLAARIRHPNVVQTIDVVTAEGELFLVMEFVQGEAVSRLMRLARSRKQAVPHRVAAAIVAWALHGLHAAHETKDEHGRSLSLVHRDVSPQNIIVGIDGLSRVLDFGIARASGRVHTSQAGKVKGKLSYLSPEQIESREVTRRADVYGASVVLWELLSGRRLFHADSHTALVARVLHDEVPPPSSVNQAIPAAYDVVVMKGLARDPAERYATAREMARALEACDGVESLAGVSAWIEDIAGEVLNERAERVARVERATEFGEVSELRDMVNELASGTNPAILRARRLQNEQAESANQALPSAPVPSVASTPAAEAAPRVSSRRRMAFALVTLAVAVAAVVWHFARGEPPIAAAPTVAPVAKPPLTERAPTPAAQPEPSPTAATEESASPVALPSTTTPASARSSAPRHRASGESTTKKASPFKGLGGRL